MNTIMFRCPCGHVWPVPENMADKPATCPGCDQPSGCEGFSYFVPQSAVPDFK